MRTLFISAVILTTVGLRSGPPLSAQPAPQARPAERFLAKLLENRYALSARGGQLSGAGAQVLRSAIAQSRFVLLGEEHGVAQTPEFMTAVCKAAGPQPFHTMAVEEGPLVAAELEVWARRPDGLANVAAFEKKFPYSINVYKAREEFDMLEQCTRAGESEFHIWGLNQEGLNAGGVILSRVLETQLGSQARAAMQQLLSKNDDGYRKALQSDSIFDFFMIAADDKEFADSAALLQSDGSPDARTLFSSLVESHEINRTPPAAYPNARHRERLMKTLFAANYARAERGAAGPPKVLLKFGAFHLYRGLNPVHGSGIGNYVAEFAEAHGDQSLHIYLMPVKGSQPIWPRVSQPAQLRSFNHVDEARYRYLQPVFANLLASEWTMFDLRPLRQEVATPGGAIDAELTTLVFGYDILIVVPEGTPSVTIVRVWTRVYTWGAPSELAEQRCADIESDLWEQQQDPNGSRGLAPAVQILLRLFTGIADDFTWRVEHTTLQDNVVIRRAVTLAVTTVALSVLWGSSGAAPRIAGCSGAPRKPKVEQVVQCVGAFFESSPRPPTGTSSGTRISRRR
jgi:hypothetical protein